MNAQPDAETTNYYLSTMLGSEDSDEETSQEEPSITNWNELSIIERVGLNSVEMSEKDLEAAFCQIALAFRCDQYTLKQRLQAEEHARNLAEENIQLELTRGRETLEMLKGLCMDSKRSMILQRLELSLDILGGTVERISNTAEVLGAVHQEARVSHEVELMVAYVENLRRQHERNVAELEVAKKTIQHQISCRNSIDQRASPDPEESDIRKKCSHRSIRHRVSITLIPSKIQEKIKQDSTGEDEARLLKKQATPRKSFSKEFFLTCPSPPLRSESSCSPVINDKSYSVDDRPLDPEETPSEAPAAELPSTPNPKSEYLPWKQLATRKIQNKKSLLETLRQRHKGKAALSKKKADKDKKSTNIYRQLSASPCGSLWRHHPLAHWLYRCCWARFCVYLVMLFCVVTLAYLFVEAS